MPRIPSILEQELRNLKPSGIESDFLKRLVSCAEGTDAEFTSEDREFEAGIRSHIPAGLPAQDQEALLGKIGDAPFHVDEKIVLFNKSNPNSGKKQRPSIIRFNFAAAAAVALLGTIAALMLPGTGNEGSGGEKIAGNEEQIIEKPAQISPGVASSFSPVSLNRNLSETRDEGVIWRDQTQPHRVMRMTYMDRVTLSNDKGETIEVSQPKVEYVVMPEKID